MDRNYIIIIGLVIIIIVLLVGLFFIIQQPAKEPTKLTITTDTSLNEGESIKIRLTDSNGTPITGQTVNITITDSDGTSDYHSIVTDNDGVGEFKLDKSAGNYIVNASYGGNENYDGDSIAQNLEIKEDASEVESTQTAQSSSSSSSSSGYYGPEVDSSGITREEAQKYGWTYTPEHGGHYIGSNDAWDEEAGVYHD